MTDMTEKDKRFLDNLTPEQRFWWDKMIKKHGSIEAVRDEMSGYTTRRKTIGGFTDPEVLKKAQATRAKNRG